MLNQATLLAVALTLALPAFADPAPKAHGTQQIKKPKPAGIPIDSFGKRDVARQSEPGCPDCHKPVQETQPAA
jgi:hypothetical protein